jgi:hypothetical protein
VLINPEPLLPTRGYRVLCHDATLIDLEAEAMWPIGTQLEFTITTLVISLPRQVVVGDLTTNPSSGRRARRLRAAGLTGVACLAMPSGPVHRPPHEPALAAASGTMLPR